MKGPKSIRALFSFPGFVAASALKGVFGDRYARVMVLRRRNKEALLNPVWVSWSKRQGDRERGAA